MSATVRTPAATRVRLIHGTASQQTAITNAYHVSVLGEVVNIYDVPVDHTHAVLFEDAASNVWWGHVATAESGEAARQLLLQVTDDRHGKACVVALPR